MSVLAEVSEFIVPLELVEDTLARLRKAGEAGYEAFVLWGGQLDPDDFPTASFDAVFVMNCFEQLPDPAVTLRGLRRLLRDDGSLVIRTPDADFVRDAHTPALRATAGRTGVLGVPFVRCLSSHALDEMLRAGHFQPVASRGVGGPWMQVAARAA